MKDILELHPELAESVRLRLESLDRPLDEEMENLLNKERKTLFDKSENPTDIKEMLGNGIPTESPSYIDTVHPDEIADTLIPRDKKERNTIQLIDPNFVPTHNAINHSETYRPRTEMPYMVTPTIPTKAYEHETIKPTASNSLDFIISLGKLNHV